MTVLITTGVKSCCYGTYCTEPWPLSSLRTCDLSKCFTMSIYTMVGRHPGLWIKQSHIASFSIGTGIFESVPTTYRHSLFSNLPKTIKVTVRELAAERWAQVVRISRAANWIFCHLEQFSDRCRSGLCNILPPYILCIAPRGRVRSSPQLLTNWLTTHYKTLLTPHICVCVCLQVEQVRLLDRYSNKFTNGTLYLTATHLIFVESGSNNTTTSAGQEIWVSGYCGKRHPAGVMHITDRKAQYIMCECIRNNGPTRVSLLQIYTNDSSHHYTYDWLSYHIIK